MLSSLSESDKLEMEMALSSSEESDNIEMGLFLVLPDIGTVCISCTHYCDRYVYGWIGEGKYIYARCRFF